MPRFRLLALDIDGTLVNSRDELTPAVRDALRRATAAGIQIVLATGRRYSRALPFVAPLGLDVPLITASGALVKHPLTHATLHQAAFDEQVLLEALKHMQSRGYQAVLYSDSFAHGFDFHCVSHESNSRELADFYHHNPNVARAHADLMTAPPKNVFAGFAIGTREEMLVLAAELTARWPTQLYVHVIRSTRYLGHMCEIAPAGATKWQAIRRLAHEWGITDSQICAVGDDVNDIPMVVGAGLGIAMANAVDELKAVADAIAPSNDEDGLVEVVKWIM